VCHRVLGATASLLREFLWHTSPDDTDDSVKMRELCCAVQCIDVGNCRSPRYSSGSLEDNFDQITTMALSRCRRFLFTGTARGRIHLSSWPVPTTDGGFLTSSDVIACHCGVVRTLRVSNDDSLLFSSGDDGMLMISSIILDSTSRSFDSESVSQCRSDSYINSLADQWSVCVHSEDVVQASAAELEAKATALDELMKQLEISKTETDFVLRRSNASWETQFRHMQDDLTAQISAERERLDELKSRYESLLHEHHAAIVHKESQHVQNTHKLENQYEQRLTSEMERYDTLKCDIDNIRHRCEGLLSLQQSEHETALQYMEGCNKRTEKELRQQIDRLHEDSRYNEQMFREVLDQQEHEYETELQQLMLAAQSELSANQMSLAEARDIVQARNTKIARLEKRMDELKTSSHARDVLLIGEQVRTAKLDATVKHFKRHMEARESTLEDKELAILGLRRNNVVLDNFRLVLDHRMQHLAEVRNPYSQHIQGLEAHVCAMYEELETEYHALKRQLQQLETKDCKIQTLERERCHLRGMLTERDAHIASFKRELSTWVALTTPKEIERAVKNAYHRSVKSELPRHRVAICPSISCTTARCSRSRKYMHQTKMSEASCTLAGATGGSYSLIQHETSESPLLHRMKTGCLNSGDDLFEAHARYNYMQRSADNLQHRLKTTRNIAFSMRRTRTGSRACPPCHITIC